MRYVFLVALAATSALATPAFAQDADPTFTGPRIAVLGGYDGIRPGSSEDSDLEGDDQTVDGFLYGVEAGYDIAIGSRAVIGADLEYSDSTGKVETDTADPEFFGFGRVSTGRDLYVGLRAGLRAAPNTLVYAKGGYTNARLNVRANDGTTEFRENFEVDGWRLGAGLEQALGPNAFAKVEYRYSNYSNANFEFADGAVSGDFDIDTDRHQVVAGLGWRV